MPLTLKGTGLATNLKMCLAVDDDGVTIKEFVSSDVDTNKTLGTGVAAGVGAATWKGTSRGYFPTFLDGPFDYFGVRFASGHRPLFDAGSAHPFSFFAAMRAMGAGSNARALLEGPSSGTYMLSRPVLGGPLSDTGWGGGSGSTNMPSDLGSGDTKFSIGYSHDFGVSRKFYYGLESGSLAADGTGVDAGFGSDNTPVLGVGGASGQGPQDGNWHVVCIFNKELSLAEFQSLHGNGTDDWFTTLFAGGGGGGLPAGAESAYLPGGMQPQTSPLTISKW